MGILLCKHADDVMFCGCHAHFGTQKELGKWNLCSTTREECEEQDTREKF